MCTAAWLPSTSTGMPRACAMRMISFTGTTVPSTFDMCVMATILVCLGQQPLEVVDQELARVARSAPI